MKQIKNQKMNYRRSPKRVMMDDSCLPLVTIFTFDFLINVGISCVCSYCQWQLCLFWPPAPHACPRFYANVPFCMCSNHDCQTSTASKWALAPHGESAMLSVHSSAYEFRTALLCCVLKEIGKWSELKWSAGWMLGKDNVYRTMYINWWQY